MDKITLKATLIRQHEDTLQGLLADYANYRKGGILSLGDVHDADDTSHKTQAEEYLEVLEKQIHQRENELEALKNLDFGPKLSVTKGSIALVGGNYYIIGIPACQFDLGGKHFIAMSPEAPFYRELMDRVQNDSFVFNGKDFTVDSVF